MTTKELLKLHRQLCAEAQRIMLRKNHDYTKGGHDALANFRGAEFLNTPSEIGLMIRMMDKFKRIETFVHKGTLKVKGESADDAISDLINYTILLAGLIRERQGKVKRR